MGRYIAAARLAFRRWKDYRGRSGRLEFWSFTILMFIVYLVVDAIDSAVTGESHFILLVFGLVTLVPSFTLSIRRLHDIDKSGWWLLLTLVPLVGGLVILVFNLMDGTAGGNRFGGSPKEIAPPQGM